MYGMIFSVENSYDSFIRSYPLAPDPLDLLDDYKPLTVYGGYNEYDGYWYLGFKLKPGEHVGDPARLWQVWFDQSHPYAFNFVYSY